MLFPGRPIEQALPALEKIRSSIESYRMNVRSDDRPKDLQEGSQRRGTNDAGSTSATNEKVLSVTVSIGASERESGQNPSETLRAADKALYRAQEGGRNRVSR